MPCVRRSPRPVTGLPRAGALCVAGALALAARTAAPQVLRAPIGEYHHDTWRLPDGLPGTYVEAILQSPDGYLWFSTLSGLVRFDGVRFSAFDRTNTPALRDADTYPTRPLLVDRRGVMWIGTTAGLVRYENGQLRRAADVDGVATEAIAGMVEDSAGTVWAYEAGEGSRLLVMRAGRLEAAQVRPRPPPDVTALAAGSRGDLWVGTAADGLVRVRDGVATAFTERDGLVGGAITALRQTGDGTLWIGTQRGFSRLKDGVLTAHPLGAPGATRGLIRSIAEDGGGGVWLGTDDMGLLHWRDGRLTSYAGRDGLSDDLVASIFLDREGSLWVGTERGLDQFRAGAFLTLSSGAGLPAAVPGALHWDKAGTLWVAPKAGGLLRGTPGAFSAVDPRHLAGIRILAIAPSRDGGVWLAWPGGVIRYRDGVLRRYTEGDGLTGGWVLAVLEDRRGRVWAGTLNGGVHRVHGGLVSTLTSADGLADDRVWCLFEDREGDIWVGTDGGVSRIAGESITSYRVDVGRRGPQVTSIHQDRAGRMWLGTMRGLAQVVGGRMAVIDRRHGLPSEVIASITEDTAGSLWLGTSMGIVRVSAEQASAVAEGRARAVRATTFGTLDGLRSAEPVWRAQPTSLRSPDGRLWFSTLGGLAVLDPRHVPHNPLPPPVRVEEVLVDRKPVALSGQLSLPPRARRLDVHYTALSLRTPRRVRFRRMLEGFDEGWVDAGPARSVSYTNLRPGRYRLRITASNDDGVWSEQGASLDFRVVPAFYQTPWFYTLVGLTLLAAAWGVVHARQRQLEGRFELVLGERNRMAREIHDTLLQGFTGITLQLQAASQQVVRAPERAKEEIERILALADRTLVDARQAVWDMRTPALEAQSLSEAIEGVTRRAAERGAPDVRFRLAGAPRPLAPAAEMTLFRIAQEAVANAVKHAAAHTIDVELAYEPRATRLLVRDDGRGFDSRETFTARGGHWGLLGMRERADRVGAQLTISSAEGRGTELVVVLPARASSAHRATRPDGTAPTPDAATAPPLGVPPNTTIGALSSPPPSDVH